MAVRPGEENVATLFGDVHYFYGPPEAHPPHHRFDKGSYVYLFENANDRRARIEIANQPGTDDQDAFDGSLDRTRVRYSYKQQCLVNILVEGVPGPPIDQSQWHLPTFDPRNENKYHYKLHSLDIYFWTHDDALQFVNGVRRVLPASQVEVADEPSPPPHLYGQPQGPISLVQKLENVAISDPQYSSPKPAPQAVPTFAPPPTSGSPSGSQRDSSQSFAPIPYNPAAPAAAEQRIHREKTPPPVEDDGHDPLAAAVARDHVAPYTPGHGAVTFPGPPPQPRPGVVSPGLASPGLTSPGFPPSQFAHTNLQRSTTMPVSGLASPGLVSPYGGNFPGSPGFAPPPPPPPQSTQHHQPTPPPAVQSPGLPPAPPGGYSQYNYTTSPQASAGAGAGTDYNIHQQLYRPTEQEHAAKYGQYKPKTEHQSRLGQNAERLEKGVTGMLKKFEKRFG
ncbi:hypothetical protein GGS23DRAFT_587761 [Durotheca rogersii]|uniref:uncharacterized protein n=1 Tax=Durotheca rogersii TaxID=419775 RepID=UPI00221ECD2E|nr:uncharacterized protein GGS23DRAFT_587761 [Durotheca rogersii]KAI5857376.1 hypothetical protein GGS23DRAFT_587761 [Durotheca rogersii]